MQNLKNSNQLRRFATKKPLVIGAASLNAEEFLVPLFARANGYQDEILIFLTFQEDLEQYWINNSWSYTFNSRFCLPLPWLENDKNNDSKQVFLSLNQARFSSKGAIEGLQKYFNAFSAEIHEKGDPELAKVAKQNGNKLLTKLIDRPCHNCSFADYLPIILEELYKLLLGDNLPKIRFLSRYYNFSSEKGIVSSVKLDELLVSLLYDAPGYDELTDVIGKFKRTDFKFSLSERGGIVVDIPRYHKKFIVSGVKYSQGEPNYEYQEITPQGLVTNTDNALIQSVLRRLDVQTVPVRGGISIAQIDHYGTNAHVPWYVTSFLDRIQARTYQSGLVPAIEYISPLFCKDLSRRSHIIGGKNRLVPSGYTFFDFSGFSEVRRFVNLILEDDSTDHSNWWILQTVTECAFIGNKDSFNHLSNIRSTTKNIISLFEYMISKGHGLNKLLEPNSLNDNVSLNEALTSIFKVAGLCVFGVR